MQLRVELPARSDAGRNPRPNADCFSVATAAAAADNGEGAAPIRAVAAYVSRRAREFLFVAQADKK
eukprot:2037736-Lingulodinium_polyedra.AAC.1